MVAQIEWLGFVRPIGLVVSAPALVRAGAGAILDRRDMEGQRLLRECLTTVVPSPRRAPIVIPSERSESRDLHPTIADFQSFAAKFLNWSFSPT